MKDVAYFLEAEDNYVPSKEPRLNEEFELEFPTDPLSFLGKKRFHAFSKDLEGENFKNYGLSPVEVLIFKVFLADLSWFFRGDAYNPEIPELVQEMREILEIVIAKAPVFEGAILYRFCNGRDRINWEIGEEYIPPHSLTTTADNWEQRENVYVITPLKACKTKAHSLYSIHMHGDEKQVNFLTGAKFRINLIEQDTEGFSKIYMSEIE